ncbi:TetR/AcrR family transcriptional regulator [Agromyces sp. LHK192]|uniref:TetR/AcrR family transcriptional regulator n=1 Tax=Agromyces sp. LHK192 TaxID=2498704 RepID=UPI000FDA258D|nr:TetR/AcrR family transcriptional regulator [Agromyces sp. LHK192]
MRPGPRRSLTQRDIVAAAFEILEQKGFAAVSVRGVAAALGLTPTAMYTYFDGKDALLAAMVEELLDGLDGLGGLGGEDAAQPAAPRERLIALADDLRARLAEHAGAIALVTSGPLDGPNAGAFSELAGAAFAAGGLDESDSARAAHALLAAVVGQIAIETAWGVASADEPATLWSDAPARPYGDAAGELGLRAGDADEFRHAIGCLVDGWLATVATDATS